MKLTKISLVIGLLLIIISCNTPPSTQNFLTQNNNDIKGNLFADTIIYEVILKYSDSTNPWKFDFIKNLDRLALVDSLFEAAYNEPAKAFDYFSNTPLDKEDIKNIENSEGFSRNNIGKLQFAEAWYFDKKHQTFKKEVISVTLGLELYSDGIIRGYKPVFKLMLN